MAATSGSRSASSPELIQQLEAVTRAAFGEDADQFVAHALGRHFEDQRMQALHRRHGDRLDAKIEARREAHRAQQPQMIFAKAHLRIADGAHDALLQVRAAVRRNPAPRPFPDRAAAR